MKNTSPVLLILAIVALAGVFAAGLRPAYLRLQKLRRANQALRLRLQEQEILHSFSDSAVSGQEEVLGKLPIPQKGQLAHDRIPQLHAEFSEKAKKGGLELAVVAPEVRSLQDGAQYRLIRTDILLSGEFGPFRQFLIDLINTPYVDHIESVHARRTTEGREFSVKAWLTVE